MLDLIEPSDLKQEQWTKPSDQVVRKAELPKELLVKDLGLKTTRRFLSEDRQTVLEETRARASGLTENRSENAAKTLKRQADQREAPTDQKPRSRERLAEIEPTSIFEEGLGDITAPRTETADTLPAPKSMPPRELLLPADPRRNRGISTSGEQLPQDIQIGDFTALNTDRFVYYTYYARIEEQIRHRWVRYVKAAIFGGGDIPDGARDFTTNVEIVMNREGDFMRAIVHQGSGSRDIDAAPILAFREVRRVPHPPREMVKEDGTIRLLYSFHVDQIPATARTKEPSKTEKYLE